MKNNVILLLAICFAAFSCKKPQADFSTDKNEYSAGDVVYITNKSEHGKSYTWTFSNNGTFDPYPQPISHAEHPNDTINMLAGDGIHTIKLVAFLKKEKKSSTISKSFLVKTVRGDVEIRTPSYFTNVDVKCDNQPIGKIDGGYMRVKLPVGLRFFSLVGPHGKQSITLSVAASSLTVWEVK